MRFSVSALLFFLLFVSIGASGQDPTRWVLASKTEASKELKEGDNVTVELRGTIDTGWYLYGMEQPPGGPIATTVRIAEGSPFELVGTVRAEKPLSKPDPNFIVEGKPIETLYHTDSVVFELSVRATGSAKLDELLVAVRFQACDDSVCLPPRTKTVSFTGEIEKAPTPTSDPAAGTLDASKQPSMGQPVMAIRDTPTDLWPFIWLAITLGALSLLTPCVFPMIPITVSYFTSHASGSRAKAVRLATVYSLGIVGTFTLLGMLLAIFVGAAGLNLFASSPWINLLITAIFFFFAFNLFGAYEITIPSSVLTRLDRLTRSTEGEGSGIIGALLMGLTFTLTSFTCTSPFVGTILVAASQGDWQMPLLGMLAFSSVFALPFFVLALVPQLASQLPKAGGWMNSVKVSMGFLVVAAAMKFLSNADVIWKWGFFTRDVVLSVWIAIGLVLSVYLLGKFQLSHDSKPERIGAFRLVSAVISLAITFYLITGLFGAKLGELEAFLPSDKGNSSGRVLGSGQRLEWMKNDYEGALARGRAENKRVFLDFTGYTCTNCRWMEANIFPRPEVVAELEKFVLVSLYTDGSGEIYERQQKLEEEMFGTVAVPLYAVVEPDGTIISAFPGMTRNPEEFVDFLRKSQQN